MLFTQIEGGVCAPKGFVAGGLHCGVRKNKDKKDLAMIACETPCTAAAMYTQNKVFGAPIAVTREHLKDGTAQAVVCNSGNANTCNADGVQKAKAMAALAAEALGLTPKDIIVASTGVIGQPLDLTPIEQGIRALAPQLSKEGGLAAAQAIMTTDTIHKEVAVEFELDGKAVRIGAIAKGSGMIHPNMATMLSFITTDAAIDKEPLALALKEVVQQSYNMISVDGDTSTNDMVAILASGLAGNPRIQGEGPALEKFIAALKQVCVTIAKLLAGDGEGATRLLECLVTGAPDAACAKTVAKSVICSSLFKTAMFASDANWGRILCAIGYADAQFSVSTIDVTLSSVKGSVQVCKDGFGVEFSEEKAKEVLLEKEIQIRIDMKQGDGKATAWGCDLTYDYVRINGDYRT